MRPAATRTMIGLGMAALVGAAVVCFGPGQSSAPPEAVGKQNPDEITFKGIDTGYQSKIKTPASGSTK